MHTTFQVGATLFDNPRFRLDDPRAVDYFLDGGDSSGGTVVTRRSALTASPWYRGIDLFASLVAKLPLNVYRTIEGGGRNVEPGHPWSAALMRKSGPWWTPFQLRHFLMVSVKIEGNGYAYIDHNRNELRPLNPRMVTPVIEIDGTSERLWYVLNAGAPDAQRYQADQIIHVRGLSLDGLIGLNVFELAMESVGLGIAARKFQSLALKNSSKPGVVLHCPTKLDPLAREAMRTGWERMHSGANINRTAILDCGVTADALGFTADEVQLIETQKFSIIDIANFLGLPAHKLGDASSDGYNGLEQKNLAMLGDSLDPVLVSHEQEFSDKLLSEDEKSSGSIVIAYDRDKLTTTDTAARVAQWRFMTGGHPIAMISEARAVFGLNHLPDTDYIPEPINMDKSGGGADAEDPEPAVAPAPAPHPTPAPPGPAKGVDPIRVHVESILTATLARVSRRYTNAVGTKYPLRREVTVDVDALAAELESVESAVAVARGVPVCRLASAIADVLQTEFAGVQSADDVAAARGRVEKRIVALGEAA